MKLKRLLAYAVLIGILIPLTPSHADVFNLSPAGGFDLAGSVSLNIQINGLSVPVTFTGSGPLTETTPGSLHTGLGGSINVASNGSTLTFLGGSAITFTNPDALGFTASVPLSGPIPNFSITLIGKIHDVVFDVTGSAPLVGPSGNQTFDTTGLALHTVAGTFDGTVTACTPACAAPMTFSGPVSDDPAPDILTSGVGSFSSINGMRSLAFPISLPDNIAQTDTIDVEPGVTATVTTSVTSNLAGMVSAAAVPEPATWLVFLVILAAVPIARIFGFDRTARRS
ncbi:MAG: hypothetical protein ABI612_19865 [Betaproteobacteria bacterium]